MYKLIAFASQWGSKFGGINSFNTDFLSAFGVAYHLGADVICIVATATPEEINEALNAHVRLVPLPYQPQEKRFTEAHAQAGVDELKRLGISFDPDKTVWLGHDLVSGAAANEAAKIAGGRSAIIHHMSYADYESYAENSATADEKTQIQTALFQQAHLALAVGPLLRDALTDRLGGAKHVSMLVPGMAEIDISPAPNTFTAFLSGRLCDDAARIKQGHLGIAAFAQAQCEAQKKGMPDGLRRQPKLILRGVDFEGRHGHVTAIGHENPESELKKFAEVYAEAVINLQALPYTHDRQTLYSNLSGASVALMPSWHEGFGLVAWEAIAAGVPLIISENSGVYRLLENEFPGAGPGCVHKVNIRASIDAPFFHKDDLNAVVTALTVIANKPDMARRAALQLRSMLGNYTWPACAVKAAESFAWAIQKGSVPAEIADWGTAPPSPLSPTALQAMPAPISPLQMPTKQWRIGSGMAASQLLRAEEAQVPFDPARESELQELHDWLDDPLWPQAVRLITGAGGLGKTRLALELCQQRILAGWQAGFLENDYSTLTFPGCWETMRNLAQPLLIVIDYAETRQNVLLALIKAMLKNPGDKVVRVLLLARNGGEWWDNLSGLDPSCEALLSGYATSGPFCLTHLYLAAHDRSEAYRLALQAFAQTLDVVAPDGIPELTGEHFGRPLYLQMAALLALHGERPTTADGLTRALLNHERRYWSGLLAKSSLSFPERRAQQLLALATLSGGFATPRLAKPYWDEATENSCSDDLEILFFALMPLYPGRQGLQAVRPDLLGEGLVGYSLLQSGAVKLLDAVFSRSATQAVRRHALTVLTRMSSHRPDLHEILMDTLARHFAHCYQDILAVCTETAGPLPILAETAFNRLPAATKSQLASLLYQLFGEESVQLAGIACAVGSFLAEKARLKCLKKKMSTDLMADYATKLMNYSVDLRRAGRREQALATSKEVFNYFKKLHSKNRQLFARKYAKSLSNLAGNLGEVGEYDEALANSTQAVELYKGLAQNSPNHFDKEYAMSLGNVAIHFDNAGQHQEALDNAELALGFFERLSQNESEKYDPDYSTLLSNYSAYLSDAGQYEQALIKSNKALEIRQRLAQNKPDCYDPVLATSLGNFANFLSDVGDYEKALSYAGQALEIRQRLDRNNPDRYAPDFSGSLSNFACHLSDAGKYEQALSHISRSLEIRRGLADKYPERFAGDLFANITGALFLRWLVAPSDNDKYQAELPTMSEAVNLHDRPRLHIFKLFLQACFSAKHEERATSFHQALGDWGRLSTKDQNNSQSEWLCATAWCTTFIPEALDGVEWQGRWQQFKDQRKGRLPSWMDTTAQHLSFQWPQ